MCFLIVLMQYLVYFLVLLCPVSPPRGHSDGIPESIFQKSWVFFCCKKSAGYKNMKIIKGAKSDFIFQSYRKPARKGN